MQCHQNIAINAHLETLLDFWRLGGSVTEISSEILDRVSAYLETSRGKGYLGAIADSLHQELRFRSWLVGEEIKQPVAVEPNQLLLGVIDRWNQGLEASANEREFVAHYIQLAAVKGTFSALVEDKNEQQRFFSWLSQQETILL